MQRVVLLALLALGALPGLSRADYVVFSDGRHLKVRSARFLGDEVEVRLIPRGRMRFAASAVRYVTTDADVEEAPAPLAPPAPAARTATATPGASVPPAPGWSRWADPRFVEPILRASERHGVEPALIAAVIKVESDFRPHAVSPRGAQGLMQIMPATGSDYGLEDPFDPDANIETGVHHLRRMLDRFEGELRLALAAYNAGATTVRRYGGVPPYKETRRYVEQVLAWRQDGLEPVP